MPNETMSYTIETRVASAYLANLLDFIYQEYLLPQNKRFANIKRAIVDGDPFMSFVLLDSTGKKDLEVEVIGSKPLRVKVVPLAKTVPGRRIAEAKQDIMVAVRFFEERVRKSTLFFTWKEGEEIIPEKLEGREKKPINRMFLETQIFLFVLFIGFSAVLFLFVGWLAPITLLALQIIFVFYSNRIIARAADWRITEKNPIIQVLEYHLPLEEHDSFRQRLSKNKLMELKKEVYAQTIDLKGEIDCSTAHQIFQKYGLECEPENLTARKVNVHSLVETTAKKFGFPMPEVVVSNTIIPNAAASGPSPSRGVVLVTTGLLVQLEKDEILSVLGHEFGHLKGRDPLILFGLTAAEFLFRFYVLLPVFPFIFSSFLFFLYFWIVMTVIYFIAKFFEARADLVSALVMGQPRVLGQALTKIGFRRLLYERSPSYRFQEWISLNPHPPIYFRVNRLEKLEAEEKVAHPLVQSAKDVIKGFRASF